MKPDCPHLPDTLAAALHPGGLPAASPKLREHFHTCPACQAEFAATQSLATTLKDRTPKATPSSSLTSRILASLPPENASANNPRASGAFRVYAVAPFLYLADFARRVYAAPLLRYAAAIPLFLWAAFGVWQVSRLATDTKPLAIDISTGPSFEYLAAQYQCSWLLTQQDPDGLWRPQTTGGSPAYRPAISALAALALFRHDASAQGIARAQNALFGLQQPSGAFDASTSRAYNHGIVTTALLAMREAPDRDPELRRAISFIIATQHPTGGWGYTDADAPNTAITAWHLEALSRATELGWDEARPSLNRGLRWLRACATPSGHFAYQPETDAATSATLDAIAAATLFTAGAAYPELVAAATRALGLLANASPRQTDYYRDYFIARAYTSSGDPKRAAPITARMSAHPRPGLEDRWGAVGGDLYTTALTLLAVN